jgi:DNA-binding CsgD family transcriptional regulator
VLLWRCITLAKPRKNWAISLPRALLEESAKLFRVAGDRQLLALPIDALGLMALRQGDYAGARTHFEEALARETPKVQYTADALAHLGTVALRMGEYQESLSFYQQSLALNREQGYKEGIAEDLAGLAEVASLLGQPERAAQLLGAVEALREARGISLPPLRRAEYDRTVEGIRAQLDEAVFAEVWQEGRTRPLAQVLAAQELVTMPPTAPAGPSSVPHTRKASTSPSGLTAREVEVLRLVALGLTNPQIAEKLVISPQTVHAHLRSIYSKLGVTTRSAATRFAVEHQIV